MRVIPVMDLLGGKVVHARKGEREKYQPVKSILASTADPVEVATAFHRQFKFKELYIADLDAIQGGKVAIEGIKAISKSTSMELMVDAGVNNPDSAHVVREAGASRVIVATETLISLNALTVMIEAVGRGRIISSLDVKQGKVLGKSPQIRELSPVKAARVLEKIGVTQLIVLELTKVGSESGVDRSLVESIISAVRIPIITGGGVRNIDDLIELKEIGVDGALVATSLHNGSLSPENVRSLLL
ncbi:MAG: HisA/HisF-related TIM barrel protein [Candidatus Atabeyarchaeum deiterrae]